MVGNTLDTPPAAQCKEAIMMLIGIILWLACLVIFPPLSVLITIAWVWYLVNQSESHE